MAARFARNWKEHAEKITTVVPGLDICVCVCIVYYKRTHDTALIFRVGK